MEGFQHLLDKPLPDLMQWWLDQRSARNISALARGSGIHRDSLSRYLEEGKAQYQKAKQLVCYMFREHKQVAFKWLENHYQEQVKADFNFYQYHNHDLQEEFADENFQAFLRSPNTFRIVHLAATVGITKQQIEQSHGQYGLKYLNELVDAGVLAIYDDKYKTVQESWSVNNYDTVLAELLNATTIMGQRRDGQIFQDSIAVNEDGLKEIKRLQQTMLSEVAEIKNKYKGDLPVYVGTYLTKLD